MKNECSYVRDVLPLYLENMVSEETSSFVKEHLESCPKCVAELEAMKTGTNVEEISGNTKKRLEDEVQKSMRSIRKKFRKKAYAITAIVASVCLVLCIMLHYFPVYRLVQFGSSVFSDYYSYDQITKALYIGSAADRKEAQAVLRLADKAFHDTRHTRAENEEEYGLLSRYATPTDSYDNVAFVEYSLELLSAHLDDDEGWIWVYYSSEAFDHDGNSVCGSWRIPSLWKVEKNDTGEWVVVQIREHP